MDWEPEQQDLGALGFAGICRETYRVLLHFILPNSKGGSGVVLAGILSGLLLVHIAANEALASLVNTDDGSDLVRLVAGVVGCSLFEAVCMLVLFLFSLTCTAVYLFRVAALYCTDGDSSASNRILRILPRAPLSRLIPIFMCMVPLAILYSSLVWLELPQLDASDGVDVLALQLLGGAAFVAGGAYVGVVSHITCAVAVLEDAFLFGAVRKSRALLAGKFWAAAPVFVPLDGCFVALQIFFSSLVLEDAWDLGIWFQVAAGAAMAVALWAVLVVTLVAQPVVYLVCKNHHHEVVDTVHLNYVGQYQQLAGEGDSSVELQPVKTAQILAATSQCPDQSAPAGSSTST
ncbi:hypothetical protein ACQ4PT_064756 [Festuca glaucescens]